MLKKCSKHQISLGKWKVNAFSFWPTGPRISHLGAIFTHGYTAHKGDLINWALKLLEIQIPTVLFDLPGHYQGSFNEVEKLHEFQKNAHKLFAQAYPILKTPTIVLGGHSLGGLLALQSHSCPQFDQLQKIFIAVGLGIKSPQEKNSLAGPFMDQFLKSRANLVSPSLSPDAIFPWIRSSKENLSITNQTIHLITGQDDYVVSPNGSENLMTKLKENQNQVTLVKPPKLAHNKPERAAVLIKKFLKDFITET